MSTVLDWKKMPVRAMHQPGGDTHGRINRGLRFSQRNHFRRQKRSCRCSPVKRRTKNEIQDSLCLVVTGRRWFR